MTTAELFRVSGSALTRHKLRAFLTLLGVIIGVATVVGVVSVISGLNAYVKDKVIGLNPDIVIFTKYGIITSREEWLMARKRKDLTLTDMEVVRRECKLCASIGARGERNRPVKYEDRKLPQVEIQGHTPNMGEAMKFDIVNGRYFTETEYNQSFPVAVIGWDVQDELFPNIDPIGRVMKIDGYPVKVIGTLAKQGSRPGPEPGQRDLHPADALPQAHRADRGHRHLLEAQGRRRGGDGGDRRGADDPAGAAQDRLQRRTIRSASSRRSCSRRSGADISAGHVPADGPDLGHLARRRRDRRSPTSCSSRSSSGPRRSACGGRSARGAGTSAGSSCWRRPCCPRSAA